MCKKDEACSAFKSRWPDDGTEVKEGDMQCYKGGLAVQENFQMCDVTSESGINGSSGLGDALMRRSEDH